MPYSGQKASKHGHSDILNNPDVQEFLTSCEEVPRPDAQDLQNKLDSLPKINSYEDELPSMILAIDGSTYESPIDGRYPSRRIGYLKISSVVLDMERYLNIRDGGTRFVDPMAVAKLRKETDTLSMALPGAYVVPAGAATVAEGFRRETLRYFRSQTTMLGGESLLNTLVDLIRRLGRVEGSGGGTVLRFKKCPNAECEKPESELISVDGQSGEGTCPSCGRPVYATDALRIFETFVENGPNVESLNRLMSVVEHLLIVHYLRYLWRENIALLTNFCFLIDGPLAIFGQPAPFHRAMMSLLGEIRQHLNQRRLSEPLVMGLVKTGRLMEHFVMINDLIPPGTVLPVEDDYRYRFVEPSKFGSTSVFGKDTYYGQDFLVKTEQGHTFVLCLAYPTTIKTSQFMELRGQTRSYPTLGRALKVIETLESALYGSSLIPVILAHEMASISLTPGGRVLDILSARALSRHSCS